MIHVTVNGVNRDAWVHNARDDVKWTRQIAQRGNASILFTVPKADFDPAVGQSVGIYEDTVNTFGGILDTKTKARLGDSGYYISCTFVSWEARLDSRCISPRTYKAKNAGDIVIDLIQNEFAAENVTLTDVHQGSVVPKVVYDYDTVSSAFDALAKESGFIWWIDADRGLHFVPNTGQSAITLGPADVLRITGSSGSPQIEDLRQDFRSRQLLRMSFGGIPASSELFQGDGSVTSWKLSRVPNSVINAQKTSGSRASVQGTFVGIPAPGDYITIPNSTIQGFTQVYYFVAAIDNSQSGQVLIGASAQACAQHFADAVNHNAATAGMAYSLVTPTNAAVGITTPSDGELSCYSLFPGSLENGLSVSATMSASAFSWASATLSGGTGVGTSAGTTLQLGTYNISPDDAKSGSDLYWSYGDDTIYMLAGSRASASGTFYGLPASGDSLSIGSAVYAFAASISGGAPVVKLGATQAECAQNFADAINANPATKGTTWDGFSANSDVTARVEAGSTVVVTSTYSGPAGNSVTVQAATQAFAWNSTTLLGGSGSDTALGAGEFLFVEYYPLGSDVISVEDQDVIAARAAVEGGSGITENLIDDGQNPNPVSALTKATATLNAYKNIPQLITIETRKLGINPGMIVSLNFSSPAISGTFLVQQVDASLHSASGPFWYTITLQGGTVPNWLQFWEGLAGLTSAGTLAAPIATTPSSGGGTTTPAQTPVPDVAGLTVDISRYDRPRGTMALLSVACNAPASFGSGDAQFTGYEIYRDNQETRISLGRHDLPSGAKASDSIGGYFWDDWPDGDEDWTIFAAAYGVKYENPVTDATPHIIKHVQVSTQPPSGGVIPLVTNVAAGTPKIITGGGIRRNPPTLQVTLTFNAPANLGSGDAVFSAYDIYRDDGHVTALFGRGYLPFTGHAGDLVTATVSFPGVPTVREDLDYYVVSRNDKYSNALIKKGKTNATPSATVTFVPPSQAQDVPIFKIGQVAGNVWTSVLRWDKLNQKQTADYLVMLPTDTSNFGQVGVWTKTASGEWIAPPELLKVEDFVSVGDGTYYRMGRIEIEADHVPNPPETWTFYAVSYDTAEPSNYNKDASGNPTSGQHADLTTLAGAFDPNFNPPGSVTSADFSVSAIATPNTFQVTATYTPPAQTDTTGPLTGVHAFLTTNSRIGIPEDLGSFPATSPYASDGTPQAQTFTFTHIASVGARDGAGATDTWTLTFRSYGANNTGTQPHDVTVSHSVGRYQSAGQIANDAALTATVYTVYDDAGQPKWGLDGSFRVPTDPTFWYCQVEAQFDSDTQATDMTHPADGSVHTDSFAYPPASTGMTVTFLFVNRNGEINRTGAPTRRVTVTRPTGTAGQEWAPLVTAASGRVEYSVNESGSQVYRIICSWTNPPIGTTRRPPAGGKPIDQTTFRGVIGYFAGIPVFTTAQGVNTSPTPWMPSANVTWNPTIYLVSYDGNGRENSIVASGANATPSITLTVSPQAPSLDPRRFASDALDFTLSTNVSGKFGIPDNALTTMSKFGSAVKPVAVFTFGQPRATLPNSAYPPGTYAADQNTSPMSFIRVSSSGMAWEAAVHGGQDIQANTITVNQLNAASISAAYATLAYVQANYVSTNILQANYASITALTSGTIVVSRAAIATSASTASTAAEITCTLNNVTTIINNYRDSVSIVRAFEATDSATNLQTFMYAWAFTILNKFQQPAVNIAAFGPTAAPYGYVMLRDNSTNRTIELSANFPRLNMNGGQVLTVRQPGPGTPIFSSLADAQSWCSRLLTALGTSGHGLVY